MKSIVNFYQLLRIPNDASTEQIREAYLEATKRYHPDISEAPYANQRFIQIKQAYEVLKDGDKRKQYDRELLKSIENPLIEAEIHYSVSQVPALDQPQVVYALAEFNCKDLQDAAQLPPLHLCLVIDCSTSMQGDRLDLVKTNVNQLIRRLRVQDILSVVKFNDRAEKTVLDARGAEHKSAENIISLLSASGGTEIFKGLEAGIALLQTSKGRATRILLLITDGQTYGDEQACLQIARQSKIEGIVINAAGIGNDWNDTLLDQVAAITGGVSEYIGRSNDLFRFFQKQIDSLERLFARNLRIAGLFDPGCELRAVCKISPDVVVLPVEFPLSIGSLLMGKKTSVLFEFLVQPMERHTRSLYLLEGQLQPEFVVGSRDNEGIDFLLSRPLGNQDKGYVIPPTLLEAVSSYNLYCLQERARTDLAAGNVEQATRRLQHIATHLLAQGKSEMANVVLSELRTIQDKRTFGEEGEKRVKYGTRALMLPSGLEEE